ncbi:MAG: serine hydrolase [Gemmataceae bacterium]|nr:serine hydrolase [Gemmataceae bacterium]
MRRFLLRHPFLLACAALLLARTVSFAQATDAAAIDAIVQEAVKAWKVPGAAVAVVRGDEVIYLKGHGVREVGKDAAVTPDTLFACASTSKAFTAMSIAMLVHDGKVKWDDPVRKYVDFFRLADSLADENVTLRDIVTHRTGLSRNDLLWYGSPWDREEIIRRIGKVPLTKSFRSAYQYQNIMYLTAGYAAGKADGTSWETLVQKRIFEPLGMAGANFSAKNAEKAADHATPHLLRKEDKVEAIRWLNIDNVGPAGSINAGVRDLSKWLRFQLGDGTFDGKRLISQGLLRETHSTQMVIPMDGASGVPSLSRTMNPETNMMSYGLGWIVQDYRGHIIVSHGGSIDGFRAQVVLVPKAKIGIAILSNLGRTQFPEALRNTLVDQLLNTQKRDWNALYLEQVKKSEAARQAQEKKREASRHKDTKPSRDLAAYAGSYEHPAYGTVTLTLDGGALVLAWSNYKMKLEHYHFDTFTLRGDDRLDKQQVVFALNADADVERVGFVEQEFKRVKSK